jgi:hypothetical protein
VHPNTRACVAYTAAKLISGGGSSSVYDYSQSRYVNVGGSVSKSHVGVFDYERGCHFSGSLPNLYDYGRSAHVSLQIDGNSFSGFDYGDSHHFSGTVNGNSVSLYDYGEGRYFSYSV